MHHTKTKGDIGVLKIAADLSTKGFLVLLPLSEHQSFDLVVYKNSLFLRIQVKFRSVKKGVIKPQLWSSWSDSNGTHKKAFNEQSADVIALYCPELDSCYYLTPSECFDGMCLRVYPTKNKQSAKVRWADDYKLFPSIPTWKKKMYL